MSDQNQLINALIEAQKKAGHAQAAAINPAFSSKYVQLEDLIDYVTPIFNECGIWIQQKSHIQEGGICVETVFQGHGASISSGMVFVRADKQTPQGYGSAMTYARRYSLSLATGVGGDKDDDGNKAQQETKTTRVKTRQVRPAAKKVQAVKGTYQIKLGESLIVASDTPDEFLEMCRTHLAQPNEKQCQDMFADSLFYIESAQKDSVGETSAAFNTLRGLYRDK